MNALAPTSPGTTAARALPHAARWLLLAPLAVWLIAFVVAPALILVAYSFSERDELGRELRHRSGRMAAQRRMLRSTIEAADGSRGLFEVHGTDGHPLALDKSMRRVRTFEVEPEAAGIKRASIEAI